MKKIKLVCLLICTCIAFAQAQSYKAAITYEGKPGLYKIKVPQSLQNAVGTNFSSVRILDAANSEAPFKVVSSFENRSSSEFETIPNIIQSKTDTTSIILIPNSKSNRDNLVLKIANAKTNKDYKIDGSNDQEKWYSLLAHGNLNQIENKDQAYVFKEINFPVTDYKWLKITINNNHEAPLQILQIGDWKTTASTPTLEQVLHTKYSIETKSKITTIQINKSGKAAPQLLQINIGAPAYFNRNANVYVVRKAAKNQEQKVPLFTFTLKDKINTIPIHESINDSIFYIEIANEDNPALKIDSIKLFVTAQDLIVQLEANKQYSLFVDPKYSAPNYDIRDINLSGANILTASMSDVVPNNIADLNALKSKNSNRILLWIGSLTGVLIVFFFGYRLLKDMQSQSKK